MKNLYTHTLPLPTPEEMHLWDAGAVSLGLPEFALMENASRAALDVLQQELGPLKGKYILLFMGSGNNGGDAACLARHLLDAGALPLVLHTKAWSAAKGTTGAHARLARRCGVPFLALPRVQPEALHRALHTHLPRHWLHPYVVVDGLLGTGFEGTLRQDMLSLVQFINTLAAHAHIFSLDVPSGCHALTGKASPEAVRAHTTVCFAAAKPGLVLPEAHAWTGKVHVRPIGIPRAVQEKISPSFRMITGAGAEALLPKVQAHMHKNSFGHVLVIGGSPGLTGAAHLTAMAALRSGAGLVSVAAPAGLVSEITSGAPEIMTIALGKGQDTHWPLELEEKLVTTLGRASALAVGPGMGTDKKAVHLLRMVLASQNRPPAVLDADALNILAQNKDLAALLLPGDVLTPHPGEAARLLGINTSDVQADRNAALQRLTKLAPCCWVLKGAASLLTQKSCPTFILPHDLPSLAVAGSGDVLSGCMAALLGQGLNALRASMLGMAVHARAGHLARGQYPQRGHTALDLSRLLPEALATLSLLPEISGVEYNLVHP